MNDERRAVYQIHPNLTAENFDYLLRLKSESRIPMATIVNMMIDRARSQGWAVSMSETAQGGDS